MLVRMTIEWKIGQSEQRQLAAVSSQSSAQRISSQGVSYFHVKQMRRVKLVAVFDQLRFDGIANRCSKEHLE